MKTRITAALLLLVFISAALTACTGSSSEPASVIGTWKLVETYGDNIIDLDGSDSMIWTIDKKQISIAQIMGGETYNTSVLYHIDGNKLTGTDGHDNITYEYSVDAGKLTLSLNGTKLVFERQ